MKVRDINPFGLRMPADLREFVAKQASMQERSQNWVICKALREAKERDEQSNQA